MRRMVCKAILGLSLIYPSYIYAATLLDDYFSGSIVDSATWHIPTWVSQTDGTYIGRTQFRCSQNSSLPAINNGNVILTVETYNPTGFSFYGTDLISNQLFSLNEGISIKVRAKMDTSIGGIVGGIFLYALKPDSNTLHDEIDFEFLTNRPDGVQTNIYADERLGVGHPQFFSYPAGSITDYHIYEINWIPGKVSWFVDGRHLRTETSNVPLGPMNFHLNIWVPSEDWVEAYDVGLQPTNSEGANQTFSMSVDSVEIYSITSKNSGNNLTSFLNLLLLK